MHVVVDTSFWVNFSRRGLADVEALLLEDAMRDARAVMSQLVWLELWVGMRSPAEQALFREVRSVCLWEPMSESDGFEAEKLAVLLHKKGLVLPASDLLILTVAKRLDAQLLHHDVDFTRVLKLPEFAGQRAR